MEKPLVVVIAGPTASGKTNLSIELAKKINGEIISCDSMQIYKYMDIGTAKTTKEEMQGIPHYMIDIVLPNEAFSVSEYKKMAEIYIEDIIKRGKIPIVVGGTGLYINSLIYGIEYEDVKIDEEYRLELEKIAQKEGLQKLYEMAKEVDEEATSKISVNDKKRIMRILEIYKQTGKTKTQQIKDSRKNGVKYNYKIFALNMDRAKLYDKINKRVDLMIEKGLVQEVEKILNNYDDFPTAMQAIGYKEICNYLNGNISEEEAIEKIKMESRRYAKRQLTWLRKIENVKWIDSDENMQSNINIILEEIK